MQDNQRFPALLSSQSQPQQLSPQQPKFPHLASTTNLHMPEGQENIEDACKEDLGGVLLSSTSIEQMYESQRKYEKFLGTLGSMVGKKLPEPIHKHIHRKPTNLKTTTHTEISHYISQRIEKMIKNKRLKKNWTVEDLLILIWLVGKYVHYHNIKDVYYGIKKDNWNEISSMIPASTGEGCMFKWLGLKKVTAEWKKAEEELLVELAKKKQKNGIDIQWNQMAKQLFYANTYRYRVYRGGKQCRERWNCFLNPKIKKGLWDKEEDIKLIQLILYSQGRDKKWSKLVPEFDGRTENALKNRYHLLIEKQFKLLGVQKRDDHHIMEKFLQRCYLQGFISEKEKMKEPSYESLKSLATQTNPSIKHFQSQKSQLSQQLPKPLYRNEQPFPEIKVVQLNTEELTKLKSQVLENQENYLVCRMLDDGMRMVMDQRDYIDQFFEDS